MAYIYLDNCATTRVCEEAAAKAVEAMTEHYGNPSSLHGLGVDAQSVLTAAREQIAAGLHCDAREIVFTSGGTEANNLAVFGAAKALRRRGERIVTTQIEHSSVARAVDELEKDGFEVVRLKPGEDGSVSETDLMQAVTPRTILVSMMLVNNETGAIQPVNAARRAVKAAGAPALIHCDCVQAFGKLPISPAKLGVDLLSISAHKIHAPKGAGALYVSKSARILPVSRGGGQERGLRSGTEPVPAIAAFGEAARLACEGLHANAMRLLALRTACAELLRGLGFVTVNSPENGAPHILNISAEGVRSEIMLHYLASKGIYVSSGSACGRGEKSPVLAAMSLSNSRIDSALRISFSRYNTIAEVEALANALASGWRELEHVR